MKRTLIIGSTCVDVIMRVDQMPLTGQDANITRQRMALGGCAFNVSDILRHFGVPYTLCSPVGTGIYGDWIREEFARRELPVFSENKEKENGCCYCIVDKNGERTFLSRHGAEYLFNRNDFDGMDMSDVDSVFICGLELEEETGLAEIEFVRELKEKADQEDREFTVFFSPGPRMNVISEEIMEKVLDLKPIISLNKAEASLMSGEKFVVTAAIRINSLTHNSLVITLGAEGAYYFDSKNNDAGFLPGIKTQVADTIGAGDSHFAAVISCLKKGMKLQKAVETANKVSSAVVSVKGSTLTDQEFNAAIR